MSSLHLLELWLQEFSQMGVSASKPPLVNLALSCQTLAFSSDCHLATLALGLPLPGQRENLIQRLRRFLSDSQMALPRLYHPLGQHLFEHWPLREVCLVMDRTAIEQRWSLLLVGAAYRKRVLPLAWQVLPYGSSSDTEQVELLQQVSTDLPPWAKVRVLSMGIVNSALSKCSTGVKATTGIVRWGSSLTPTSARPAAGGSGFPIWDYNRVSAWVCRECF
jgi:hypothetical protein